MNWKRGLLRLWTAISLLWLGGTVSFAVVAFSRPGNFGAHFQYVEQLQELPWNTDWSKPFYERSSAPGKGSLPDYFSPIENQYVEGFDKAVRERDSVNIEFPDGSNLYLNSQLTEEDKTYLSRLFWNERWKRYASRVVPFLGWGLLPPLSCLLFGLLTSWILRGFKAEPPASNPG